MKKLLLFGLAAIMAMGCTKSGYQLKVALEGVEDGTAVYLSVMQGKLPSVVGSATVVDGVVEFRGELELPMLAQIAVGDSTIGATTLFFIENSPITIQGSLFQTDSIKVTGSAEQELYEDYLASKGDGVAFVKANPKSIAAAYVLFRRMAPGLTFEQLREYHAGFAASLRGSVYLELVEDMANKMELTSPGHKFVDFTLPDVAGTPVALSSIAGRGDYVLLDFWASWCGPCRVENPNVVAAYNKFKDRGFTVFGVSLDRPNGRQNWMKAIEKDSLMNWTNVSDLKFWNCVPAATYGVRSIPSNVLIDPDGMIVARNLKGAALTAKLEELLAPKAESSASDEQKTRIIPRASTEDK